MFNGSKESLPVADDDSNTPSIFYAVYIPNNTSIVQKSNFGDYVFDNKNDCLAMMKQEKGARFKTFNSKAEATSFVAFGDSALTKAKLLVDLSNVRDERPIPFSSPAPQQHVKFRKIIEKGDLKAFDEMIALNPRYLVSKADTPSILKEGPRYNALHVACLNNKPEMCTKMLDIVSSSNFFERLYPDDDPDWNIRRKTRLLDLYLNTPDKSQNRTPLHYASVFGCVECVRVLVSYPTCNKHRVDRYNDTASQIICSRNTAASPEIRSQIEILLGEHYYVPIFHDEEKLFSPKIGEPMSPSSEVSITSPNASDNPLCPSYKVHGYAGPMSPQQAKNFHSAWTSPKGTSRNRIASPILERVGRTLAMEYKVSWKEYWDFLDEYINICSSGGLQKLDDHLKKKFDKIMTEREEIEDVFLDSFENAPNESTLSSMGALCLEIEGLRLNRSMSPGNSPKLKHCRYIDESFSIINNNNINLSLEDEREIDLKSYILQSIFISSNRLVSVLQSLIDSASNLYTFSCLRNARKKITTELRSLNDVICKIETNLDLGFVHRVLAAKVLVSFEPNDVCLLNSVLQSMEQKMGLLTIPSSDEEEDPDNVCSSHFKCVLLCLSKCIDLASEKTNSNITDNANISSGTVTNMESKRNDAKENGAHYSENKSFDWEKLPLCNCKFRSRKVSKFGATREGGKFRKANEFINILFEPTDPVVKTLYKKNEDDIDDSDSFESAKSTITDESLKTPEEGIPVYIHGTNPTETDARVFSALELIKINENYPNVRQWMDLVSSFSQDQRQRWNPASTKRKESPVRTWSPRKVTNLSSTPNLLKKSFYSHFSHI